MSYGRRSVIEVPPVVLLKTAVIYARVSTKEQEQEGFSLDAQLGLLRQYAATHGVEVQHEFLEADTARESGRREFQRMLTYVRTHGVQAILCEKVDRLYRNLGDRVKVGEVDVELHFVKEGTVLSKRSKSHEQFVHDIKLIVAKNYVDNLSEEAKKGMEEKAKQGFWPSHAPLGYLNVVEGRRRVIAPDPLRGPQVRQLFQLYGEGRTSLEGVRDYARAIGLVSRLGKAFHTSMAARLLTNRIYCGDIQWNGVVYPGVHEPLVSKELWQEVQAIMQGRNSNKTGFGVKEFSYKGVFTCTHCGCAITAELKKGKYIYYHCTGRRGKCPGQKCIEETAITAQIMEMLGRLRIAPSILEMLRDALRESLAEEQSFHDDQRQALEAGQKKLEQDLETLYLDKINGQVPLVVFEKLKKQWEEALETVKAQLAGLGLARSSYYELGANLLELGSNCHSRFEKASGADKRDILKALCSNCELRDGFVYLSLKEPFKSMLEINDRDPECRDLGIWLAD